MDFRINNIEKVNINNNYRQEKKTSTDPSFKSYLGENLEKGKGLKISSHAESRMLDRGISLNINDIRKIEKGIVDLDKKGCKEGLVLYKDMAFIAGIKNNTIITAMKKDELETITNIDSAIMIK